MASTERETLKRPGAVCPTSQTQGNYHLRRTAFVLAGERCLSQFLSRCRSLYVVLATLILVLAIGVMVVGLTTGFGKATSRSSQMTGETGLPSAVRSQEGQYRYAAVATEVKVCSSVGVDILAREQGSAVDAAIASLVCVCVVNFNSCGVGGGLFMTIYERATESSAAIMSRETAPAAADEMMFTRPNISSQLGGMAIAIPGEVKGLWEAWERNGRVPWKKLFTPSIRLCREGFQATEQLIGVIEKNREFFKRSPEYSQFVTNPETKDLYKTGDIIRHEKLAQTLETIAEGGVNAFYTGELARNITLDIQDAGGIITEADLVNYNYASVVEDPIVLKLKDGSKVHAPPPPSSGVVYEMMLKILEGYNFTEDSISTEDKAALTWHRVVETFKFAFSKRSLLGDSDVEDKEFKDNMALLIKNFTSSSYASYIRSLIWDNQTHEVPYYKPAFQLPPDGGTTHVSVLAPNGDAVSCTTTINADFGSKVHGARTGILFNNEMDDFSTPNTVNFYGIPASPANFIKPMKRPMSSMTPVIVTNSHGDVRLVTGAGGGTQIITGVLLNTIETLWFGMGIKQAIDYPRLHHMLVPNSILAEGGFSKEIIDSLRSKGHDIVMMDKAGSGIQGILRLNNGHITAGSDYRKQGASDGY
ncbi:hypothetical protein ScPMuIL_006007 [Solemya velum]